MIEPSEVGAEAPLKAPDNPGQAVARADRGCVIWMTGLPSAGKSTIAETLAPALRARGERVELLDGDVVLEVYISTPLDVCEDRDVKGLYARARSGALKGFTGIDDPYEPPLNPEVEIATQGETAEESAARIIDVLEARGYLDV